MTAANPAPSPLGEGTTAQPSGVGASPVTIAEVEAFIENCIDQGVRDMARHTGDQVFDVLKRNGLLMPTVGAAIGMMTLAASQILGQAIDFANRSTDEDCGDLIMALFDQLRNADAATGTGQ